MTILDKTGTAKLPVEAGVSSQPHQPRHNFDGSGGLGPKYLRTEVLLDRSGTGWLDRTIVTLAEKIIGIDKANEIALKAGTPWPSSEDMIAHLFRELDVEWEVTNPKMFERLENRSAIFVSNHPYGMPDAFAMNALLEKYRPNFRLFANSFLTCADSITHKLLFVDPFMNEKNRAMNRRSMMKALKHLKEGGDLALFPGRLCSHLKWGEKLVQDGEWTDQIRIFAEAGGADVVPVHISGRNSWRFQSAGMIHPKLRTLLILREFMRGGHRIKFTLGNPVPADNITKAGRITAPGQIARALTYAANPRHAVKAPTIDVQPVRLVRQASAAITKGKSQALEKLLKKHPVLVSHGNMQLFNVTHGLDQSSDGVLNDAVAENRFDAYAGGARVSSPSDLLDEYDRIYSHLVLWDANKKQLAGSYRYLVPSHVEGGVDANDLVTASIFEFKKPFRDLLPHSLELGRAAIGRDYQRTYAPLMMMWRGVMDILRRDKSIKYLIGPVTISQEFSPLSRHVLKTFLQTSCVAEGMSGYAVPRKAFEANLPPQVKLQELVGNAKSIADIGCVIEALENGERRLPVLYRQYANVGLEYVATGEWPELDYAMASLAILDVSKARRDFIARYLGKDKVEEFFEGR